MKTKSLLNRWRRVITPARDVFPLTMCLALLLLFLLVNLSAARQPVSTAAFTAASQNALSLPGVRPGDPFDLSGYVEVPYNAALNPSGGQITIEAWVKRNAYDRNETIVGNGWQTSYWLGFSNAGKVRFIPHGSGSIVDGNAAVSEGAWTHVAVTYDGTARCYYINGVLDKTSVSNPGPLAPAPADQSLGIGFDVDDTFTPNYFGGLIDNLRIWNVVRTAAEIKDNMFHSFGASQPGLLAEWSFDGNANDLAGGHNGILHGLASFVNEGAIPHDIHIPWVSVTPSLDGSCHTDTEYADAAQVTVDGTSVWLMHTDSDMWACFDDLRADSSAASVYLDADYTRLDPPQPEHLILMVNNDDTIEARVGTGGGVYSETTSADGKWDGTYLACCGDFPTYRAEFRIGADLLGGWDHVIGLALGRSAFDLWPALAFFHQPSTWSSSTLEGWRVYLPLVVRDVSTR